MCVCVCVCVRACVCACVCVCVCVREDYSGLLPALSAERMSIISRVKGLEINKEVSGNHWSDEAMQHVFVCSHYPLLFLGSVTMYRM